MLIVNNCVWEGRALYILHTELRVPLTVELVDRKAPLFFVFERVEHSLEVTAVWAMRSEVLHKLEAEIISCHFLDIFLVTNEVGVWHEPLLASNCTNCQYGQKYPFHCQL